MDIGNKIRDMRIEKGLTQEELADRSELTKGFISQIERDLTSPSVDSLLDILEALGTDPSHFFKREENEKITFKGFLLNGFCDLGEEKVRNSSLSSGINTRNCFW